MTHCRICGVLEDVGELVICEDCADKMNEKQKMNTIDTFVITGDVLEQLQYSRSNHIRTKCADAVRSRPLSEELEKLTIKITQREWERGYNDGCSSCTADLNVIEHNAAKQERERVLEKLEQHPYQTIALQVVIDIVRGKP